MCMHVRVRVCHLYRFITLLLVKMKEKKLLKIQPLPKVLRVQAIRATTQLQIKKH
jgi:hypothetical protein